MSWVVKVENMSKTYKLYPGPRALLRELLFSKPAHHKIEALHDISFEIEPGEAFGIVGDNGAGKSTLLKVLTGTAFPTAGSVDVRGRVSALLELGAGFHPEFTGRQNIFFSGAVMGLSRPEVEEKVDRIIDFSELADFIDEPVRTYSSGMYVRLGFAIATAFEPDILIIDEALAVGDQHFQKKCTDHILDFKRAGGTILFCSHNLYQVKTLCSRGLWLDHGRMAALGPSEESVSRYTDSLRTRERKSSAAAESGSKGGQSCRIVSAKLVPDAADGLPNIPTGGSVSLEVRAAFAEGFEGTPAIGVSIVRNDGVIVYAVSSSMDKAELAKLPSGERAITIEFFDLPLLEGEYAFNLVTTDGDNMQAYDIWENVCPFRVTGRNRDFGLVRLRHSWRPQQ